jgi:hypothetical protein
VTVGAPPPSKEPVPLDEGPPPLEEPPPLEIAEASPGEPLLSPTGEPSFPPDDEALPLVDAAPLSEPSPAASIRLPALSASPREPASERVWVELAHDTCPTAHVVKKPIARTRCEHGPKEFSLL